MVRARAAGAMAAALVVASLLIAMPGRAGAHAELVSSCPGNGEAMSELGRIRLTFDGPLIVTADQPATIRVVRADGMEVPLGPVELIGVNALVADLGEGPAAGDHVASYEVISADGDPNQGEVAFSFDPSDGAATNCTQPDDDGGSAGQIVFIAVPLAVLALALFGFNRWATGRTGSAEHHGD